MSNNSIDASIGLVFTLSVLKQYRKSGTLSAAVHHVSGVLTSGVAYIFVQDGEVANCYIEDPQGQHYLAVEILYTADAAKGPFEWTFQLAPQTMTSLHLSLQTTVLPAQTGPIKTSTSTLRNVDPTALAIQRNAIPTVVAHPDWDRLVGWTMQQKQLLYTILMAVDGRRTVQDIKAALTVPGHVIEEALHILVTMKVVVISV